MLKIKVFNYQTGEIHEIDLTPQTNVKGQCTIGRALNCDLVLVGSEVSRIHSRIIFQQEQYYFTDLCSKSGSRINNEEIKANENYLLKENDIIRIGGFVLLVEAVICSSDIILDKQQDSERRWTKDDLIIRCVGVVEEATDIKTFSFVAEPSVLFTYNPGQFVTLELDINGEPMLGSYFISSTPSRPHSLEITVKRLGHLTDARNRQLALVSDWLHNQIAVGSSVKLIGGPMGTFTCFDKPSQKLLMISSENGIMPIMSMTRWVADTSTGSDIIFFHSARSSGNIIFRRELELMAARMTNFRLAMTMTQKEPGEVWMGLTGRLSEAMLQTIAPDFRERIVYICGSDSFIQGVKAMLDLLAFPMQNYYEERLGAPEKGQNAIKNAVKEPPSLTPSVSTNGSFSTDAPTKLQPPFSNQAISPDAPTEFGLPFFNQAISPDAPTEFGLPFFNRVISPDAPTVIRPSFSNQGIPEYQQSIETTKNGKNGSNTALKELPPLNDLFPNESRFASKLSNSPFSAGLPALYVIAFLSGISIGLFSPFISTFLEQNQVGDVLIGANSTVYFLAVALGTPLVSKILHHLGLRRTMMLGLLLMGISAPLFPMTREISLWFMIRAVMGFASCFYLVSGQTALNHFCQDSNRAIASGLYAMAFSFGFGIGPVIGSALYKVSPTLTFSLGSFLILSGIIVVYIGLPERAVVIQQSSGTKIFKKLTLPLHGAFAYGLIISTLVSLYPIYLVRQNYSVEQVGYTFSVFVIGGLLATVPVTQLADRIGRLEILVGSVCIALFILVSLSFTENFIATQILVFIGGVSISPIFPLSLALIGEKLSRDELSAGSAAFTALYGCGCTAGPLLSSIVMKTLNEQYIFSFCIIILVIFGLKLMKNFPKTAIQM